MREFLVNSSMPHSRPNGLLVVDKPGGITSRDVVDQALRWFPPRTRMGHAGTLDPLATGIMVLCAGIATRLLEYVQRMDKIYRASLLLGARSNTDDMDGNLEPVVGSQHHNRETVAGALQEFIGTIQQVPPTFSATKITGKRAYDLARRGQIVTLTARPVQVYSIDLLAFDYPRLEIEVRCGKGTYIRSLARDLGERLGCGGLVERLRRTRVGPFKETDALPLDATPATAQARLLPLQAAVADIPGLMLVDGDLAHFRNGQTVSLVGAVVIPGKDPGPETAVFNIAGSLVAVGKVDLIRKTIKPLKVLSRS